MNPYTCLPSDKELYQEYVHTNWNPGISWQSGDDSCGIPTQLGTSFCHDTTVTGFDMCHRLSYHYWHFWLTFCMPIWTRFMPSNGLNELAYPGMWRVCVIRFSCYQTNSSSLTCLAMLNHDFTAGFTVAPAAACSEHSDWLLQIRWYSLLCFISGHFYGHNATCISGLTS